MTHNGSLIVCANRPEGFNPRFQVISCYCLFNGHILFLQKSAKDKLEPNKWEIVTGKKRIDEEDNDALIKIIRDELGLDLIKNKKDFIKSNYFYILGGLIYYLPTVNGFKEMFSQEARLFFEVNKSTDSKK